MQNNWRCAVAVLGVAIAAAPARAADEIVVPLVAESRVALARATGFMRAIATEGGFLWRYSPDLKERAGEAAATVTQIWVQQPGTPAMGMAFLRAGEVTKDPQYLAAARGAALALVRGQLESGGWDYVIEFDPVERARWYFREDVGRLAPEDAAKRRNISTYDDNNTQGALRFLLAFLDAAAVTPDPQDAVIRDALDYGLRKLLEAQYPIGAWPQRWDGRPRDAAQYPVKRASLPTDYPREQPSGSYYGHYTFNDNTQRDVILTLLDAHRRTGRAEYLAAAKRGADFILLAQLPDPQPAWAQQYNAAMEPAWARAFEPPAVTAGESANVVRLLVDMFLETGDGKYLDPIPAAIAWLERSAIAPGRWARYYELHTNRPIYGDRDKRIHYTLEEISEERRRGYSWQGSYNVPETIRYYQDVTTAGREAWLARRERSPETVEQRAERAARLAPRVRDLIDALNDAGCWLTPAAGATPERIETRRFIASSGVLCDFLSAAAP